MPMEGIMPVSDLLDVVGPMARSAVDIANALDAMVDKVSHPVYPEDGFVTKATGSWEGLRLGAVKTSDWRIDEKLAEPDEDWFQNQVSTYSISMLKHCLVLHFPKERDITSAYEKLGQYGVKIRHPIPFPKSGPLAGVLGDLISKADTTHLKKEVISILISFRPQLRSNL